MKTPYPELRLSDWQHTKDTLHLFLQVVGKIRLKLHPKNNHWWHVPFYVSVNGLTTGPIPVGHQLVEMEFNFHDHALHIVSNSGDQVVVHLADISVAEFLEHTLGGLKQVGFDVDIVARPYDIPHIDVESFAECHDYDTYNKAQVETMWKILVSVNGAFQAFRGQFNGKSTPVHLFWHHFDLALTWFSGKRAPERPNVSQVEREAYSHEVISFGFWFGDENLQEPAFYAYGFPAIDSVYQDALQPAEAFWNPDGGMALLKYNDIRTKDNPHMAILQFLESSYQAYAQHMDWDMDAFKVES